jgi:hypothetical protein
MLYSLLKHLLPIRKNVERDLLRFAEVEYSKENPEYILRRIYSGNLFKN